MFRDRLSKLWTAVFLMLGVLLLSTGLSFFQHEIIMGGHMWGMMSWLYLPLVAAGLALIIHSLFLYFSGEERPRDVMGLTREEKTVVDYLSRRGGLAEQRDIAKALGLSRLKTHRIIVSLRRRDVVEIQPHGRTNIVRLKNPQKTNQQNIS